MNFLITGGAGNLGSGLAKNLLSQDDSNKVIVSDKFLTGNSANLPQDFPDRFEFISADANSYNEMKSIYEKCKFDYVFHYAAVVGVDRTLNDPIAVLNDIEGIKNILKLSLDHQVKRMFYSSSSEVYGEPVEIPLNENTTPLNSKLPYAIVKNVGEAYFRSYSRSFGLDYTIMRFFNTYGPSQSDDFVIPRFVNKARKNDDIIINGDGSQTRTFLYIDDNLEFISNIIKNNECVNKTVNVGSDEEITILELAKLVKKLTNSESKIIHMPPLKEGDMTRRKPDNSLMRSMMDRNLLSIEEGLKKYLENI